MEQVTGHPLGFDHGGDTALTDGFSTLHPRFLSSTFRDFTENAICDFTRAFLNPAGVRVRAASK
jgi:hypothetical protein